MADEKASGPCSYPAAYVDSLLENRDRIWCLALLAGGQVTIDVTHRVLEKYHELIANEEAVLKQLEDIGKANELRHPNATE
jgi:hypothetical protein